MRNLLLLTAPLLLAAGGAEAASPIPGVEVDQPFPALVLPAAGSGTPTSLAELRGRKTVLHVFASW